MAEQVLRLPGLAGVRVFPQPRAGAADPPAAGFLPVTAPGTALEGSLRRFYEPRLGLDLGAVRVHTGAEADASARSVNALAYTLGRDLVFAAGRYQPGTAAGRRLLAHELAHVAQQARAPHPGAALQRQPAGPIPAQNASDTEAYVIQIDPHADGMAAECVAISQYSVKSGETLEGDHACTTYEAPFCQAADVRLNITFYHHQEDVPPEGTPAPFKMQVNILQLDTSLKVVSGASRSDDAPTYPGYPGPLVTSFPQDFPFHMTESGALRASVRMEHPHGSLRAGITIPVVVTPCT
ncbi:MAG: DUF4157 domain-containing protein [Planctomycetota bacterium]|nr:MAG: DUF4157 domain-containing protein [Planctomycetota bacterium]